ncbi:MAG: hypothetical protein JNL88_03990 [Bacteroidia bacterium]|nr:hypothetical protein [Bacteroidia bacterium]
MDHLPRLVRSMNKEQVRYFKLFAARTSQSFERKDLRLFDFLRKHDPEKEEDFLLKLYPGASKNAWYRLRNRLLGDLNKSLSVLHYDDDAFIHACHMLALFRYFYSRNLLQEARYYLRRCERSAESIENYELLDLVYGEYIRISHESLQIDPQTYVEKRKENRRRLEDLRAIDDLLAVVTYRLKTTQNFSPDRNPLLDLLKKTTDDFIKDRDLKNSPLLRFRIYRAVSQVLLQRHEYKPLEQYLLRTYREFERDRLFNRGNHDTRLQMLTYIVNTLFKTDKLRQSLQWAARLKAAMEEYNQLLFDKYFFFYYNALVINYSVLDPAQAITILEDLKDQARIKTNAYYLWFVHLNLAVLHFDQKHFKEAIRHFGKLSMLDGFKNADPSLRLKISIGELLNRYELQQADVIEYKMTRLKKEYKSLLANEDHRAEKEILDLLRRMLNLADYRSDEKLMEKMQVFADWMRKNESDDGVIIDYGNWIRGKLGRSERPADR